MVKQKSLFPQVRQRVVRVVRVVRLLAFSYMVWCVRLRGVEQKFIYIYKL
ncbi:hypothetical protein clg_34 [Corynebacterium phage CL31]|nr:hypothetical protein clg_34 [Corynebacterium phage CL31]